MKSIRLSLMVYFLGLLALALGVASWLVYETAHLTLLDKQAATKKLIETQYNDRCRDEENRLDEQLRLEAPMYEKLVRLKFDRSGFYRGRDLNLLNELGLITSQTQPNAFANIVWMYGSGNGPRPSVFGEMYHHYYEDIFRRKPDILINEDDLMHDTESHFAQYVQIDGAWGSNYRSQTLVETGEWLPEAMSLFEKDKLVAWKVNEVVLSSGASVRRGVYKTQPSRYLPYGPPSRNNPGRGGFEPPPPDAAQRALYIQVAYNVAERDATLLGFAQRRDEELTALNTETAASLHQLRTRLFLTSAATFAATVLGTWFLVRLGLAPLRRLSEAVSRVSEKDFRLQFKERRLTSELRPIVERLTHTLEQLKRAFAREKQATADISHELRTPLAALLTTTELALRKSRSAEEYREMLEDCRLSGQQMNRAVERLLALARLDAGVDTMRPERVDVAQLAEQCAALVRPLAEARGLKLRVHGGDGASLLADPDKLREVITNLLHNAIQYNRPQGSIDVSVARENGHLHVEVRDTGIGIRAEAREHIFERFYRADSSRGGEDGLHAGLGLAIVKGYVDLMGGTIHVDSAEGQGSTFHLELPVERPRSAGEVRVN